MSHFVLVLSSFFSMAVQKKGGGSSHENLPVQQQYTAHERTADLDHKVPQKTMMKYAIPLSWEG